MRYLYYCNSAYQLLGVLNLHWHRKNGYEKIENYQADLILVGAFDGAETLAKIVKEQSCFEEVFYLKKTKRNNENRLSTMLKAFSPAWFLKQDYGFNKRDIKDRYDFLSLPKYTPLMEAVWKLNPKAKIHLFEDGMAAYFGSTYLYPDSKTHHLLNKVFGYKVDFRNYERIYLDCPDLTSGYEEGKVCGIPAFNSEYLSEIQNMFADFSGDNSGEEDILWFAQFLNNKQTMQTVKEVVDKLREYSERVLYCRHPRYLNDDNAKGFKTSPDNQIWEIKALGMNNLNRNLLMSIHSTACFTPKILFGKEPYLLLFYRMLDPVVTAADSHFEEVVEKFISQYSDPSKVMRPENMEELEMCLKKYVESV